MKRKIVLGILSLILVSGCENTLTASNTVYIEANKSLSVNDISFTVEELDSQKEVKPKKPSGYYNYYEENPGYTYYVISGTAKNKGFNTLDTKNIMVQGIGEGTTYEGKLIFANEKESDFIKEIKSKEKLKFYFIILVKEGDLNPNQIELYYTKDLKAPKNSNSYDELIVWTLPAM